MENQNPTQQPIQSPVTPPPLPPQVPTPPITTSPLKSKKIVLIVGVLLLLCVIGGGFYILGTKNTKNTSSSNTNHLAPVSPSPTFEPTAIPTPIPTIQTKNTLPSDWVVKNSVACAVDIPLPPNQTPYIEKTGDITWSWQFQEGKGAQLFDLSFGNGVSAHYFNDKGLGSGQVMGIVSVNCSNNNQQYTSQTFADAISESVKKRNFYMGEEMSCQPTQIKQTMWNKELIVIDTQCKTASGNLINDTYYTLINSNKVYLIEKIAQSSNQFVKDTTDKIFNNLQFTN